MEPLPWSACPHLLLDHQLLAEHIARLEGEVGGHGAQEASPANDRKMTDDMTRCLIRAHV